MPYVHQNNRPRKNPGIEPCPFCGGDALCDNGNCWRDHRYAIVCPVCEMRGPTQATLREAKEAWNGLTP